MIFQQLCKSSPSAGGTNLDGVGLSDSEPVHVGLDGLSIQDEGALTPQASEDLKQLIRVVLEVDLDRLGGRVQGQQAHLDGGVLPSGATDGGHFGNSLQNGVHLALKVGLSAEDVLARHIKAN